MRLDHEDSDLDEGDEEFEEETDGWPISQGFPGVIQAIDSESYHLAARDDDRGYVSFYLSVSELPVLFGPEVAEKLTRLKPEQGVACYLRPVIQELTKDELASIAAFRPKEILSLSELEA